MIHQATYTTLTSVWIEPQGRRAPALAHAARNGIPAAFDALKRDKPQGLIVAQAGTYDISNGETASSSRRESIVSQRYIREVLLPKPAA